jgi:hypothetical protein
MAVLTLAGGSRERVQFASGGETTVRRQCDFSLCFLVQKACPTWSIPQRGLWSISRGKESPHRPLVVTKLNALNFCVLCIRAWL